MLAWAFGCQGKVALTDWVYYASRELGGGGGWVKAIGFTSVVGEVYLSGVWPSRHTFIA